MRVIWNKATHFIAQKRIFLWLSIAVAIIALYILYDMYIKGTLNGKDIALSVALPIILFVLSFVFRQKKE